MSRQRTPRTDVGQVSLEGGLLRIPEAARLLAVSRSSLYRLLAAGALPSLTIGHVRRVPRDAVAQFIDERVRQNKAERLKSSQP